MIRAEKAGMYLDNPTEQPREAQTLFQVDVHSKIVKRALPMCGAGLLGRSSAHEHLLDPLGRRLAGGGEGRGRGLPSARPLFQRARAPVAAECHLGLSSLTAALLSLSLSTLSHGASTVRVRGISRRSVKRDS
ncbi:MAG: hypothetical protein ACI9WU_000123 [Myxococcota bacterium]|jgi:hypothetical protein